MALKSGVNPGSSLHFDTTLRSDLVFNSCQKILQNTPIKADLSSKEAGKHKCIMLIITALRAPDGYPLAVSVATMDRRKSNPIASGEVAFTQNNTVNIEFEPIVKIGSVLLTLVLHGCGFIKCLIQIGDNIICILNANRNSDNLG